MRRFIVALATVGVIVGGGALSAGTAEAAVPARPVLCGPHHHFDIHRHRCERDIRRISWFQRFIPRFVHHAPVRHFSPVRHSPVRHAPVHHAPVHHGPVNHGGHR